jgi:hypothetical protein
MKHVSAWCVDTRAGILAGVHGPDIFHTRPLYNAETKTIPTMFLDIRDKHGRAWFILFTQQSINNQH